MDKFAVYIPVGLASTNYELSTEDSDGANYLKTKTTDRDISVFYGVGFAFYPIEKLAISLEYNRSELDLRSGNNVALKAKTNLDVIKLGVSYKL